MTGADQLRNADPSLGLWSVTGNPGILDTAASIRPDFICIDTQHGIPLVDLDISTFTALAHYGVPSLVRVEALDVARIGRALDLGADGVVIPLVDSVEDAVRAVSACRYSSTGLRSFGIQTRRVSPFEGLPPLCWIQIETAGAMSHLEDIASVEGVDALYIGPADLGLALVGEPAGDVGSVFDGGHPYADEMKAAFNAVIEACQRAGIAAGLHCGSGREAAEAIRHGFGLAAVGSDLGLLGAKLTAELSTARSAVD